MVYFNNTQPTIREVLEKANENYRLAHEMARSGLISESLGMYLKEMINMRSCCDISRLFVNIGDEINAEQRISEALSILTEICRVYSSHSQPELKSELAELAKSEFKQAYQECENLLVRTI